jgi:hypothetical protein
MVLGHTVVTVGDRGMRRHDSSVKVNPRQFGPESPDDGE